MGIFHKAEIVPTGKVPKEQKIRKNMQHPTTYIPLATGSGKLYEKSSMYFSEIQYLSKI